jgi:hypothetical protein
MGGESQTTQPYVSPDRSLVIDKSDGQGHYPSSHRSVENSQTFTPLYQSPDRSEKPGPSRYVVYNLDDCFF